MYFIIINGLLAAFFSFLIIIGIRLKFWAYLPINIVGIIAASICLYLDVNNLLNPINILLLFAVLIVVFVSNIIFTFRDFKDDITEEEVRRQKKYLPTGSASDHYKLIRDEKLIKAELDQHQKVSMQDRFQALQMFNQGNEAFLNKGYQEALEKYDRSTTWDETSIGFLNQSGVLMKLDQYEDALVVAQKAAEIQPAFYEAFLNMGVASEKLKKFEDALSRYRTAASIAPDEYEIWYCCGNVLYKINRPEEAIDAYDKSIQLYGRLYESWYYKGVCLQRINKDAEALHCFKQVLKLKPNHSQAYFRSGAILSKFERNAEAIHNYEKAIKNKSNFVTAWNDLGLVLMKTGRVKDAIRCFERATKINPGYYDAWLNIGLAQDNLGQFKKAYISFTRFLELAPGDMEKQIAITRKRVEEIKSKYKVRKTTSRRKITRPQKEKKQKAES